MCNEKSLNEVINMNEQSKFEELVLLLAQSSECQNIELNKEITKFEDFDMDFNRYKYMLETRLSGALTKVYSAIALEEPVG